MIHKQLSKTWISKFFVKLKKILVINFYFKHKIHILDIFNLKN